MTDDEKREYAKWAIRSWKIELSPIVLREQFRDVGVKVSGEEFLEIWSLVQKADVEVIFND